MMIVLSICELICRPVLMEKVKKAVEMQSVFDSEKKPNCVILDEIGRIRIVLSFRDN